MRSIVALASQAIDRVSWLGLEEVNRDARQRNRDEHHGYAKRYDHRKRGNGLHNDGNEIHITHDARLQAKK